jgi:hypothetical protein
LLISLVLGSCQCPTDIETPKETEPEYSARVLFINALEYNSDIALFNNRRTIFNKFDYLASSYSYQKISAGNSIIQLHGRSDSLLLNAPCSLDTNSDYTMVCIDNSNRAEAMLLSDSITNFISTNSYFRFIHCVQFYKDVSFKITDFKTVTESIMKPFDLSSLTPSYTGKFTISAYDNTDSKLIAQIQNYELKPGKLYNIILRGNPSTTSSKIVELKVIEYNK